MNNEQAVCELNEQIRTIEGMIKYNTDFEPKQSISSLYKRMESYKLAVTALEKQVPKKALDVKVFPGVFSEIKMPNFSGKCPTCGESIIRSHFARKGCPYCLQELDWSE